MRKRLLLVALVLMAFWGKTFACGGWDDFDQTYYNLFAQEIMKDPRYHPFLLTYDSRYYPGETLRNGNIEEWQKYLGLSYEDTYYLVFKSTRDDLQKLTKGKAASDKKLAFATPDFVKKHKQALLYLAYTKYLEPYMRIIPDTESEVYMWYWDEQYEHNAGDLDYEKVKTVLTKSWNAESDNELKLRYGYQLVRLAHYTRRFKEAVQLFDQYVKPLNMRTEMYYYALSQKAGALRGMGETEKANREFIHVFTNSLDLKTVAYSSMTFGWETEINFEDFVAGAADNNERNDIYFMMGYGDFNNPVNEIEKIIANDPNAIQAMVLMVRAINKIERELLGEYYDYDMVSQSRYPYWDEDKEENLRPFFNQAMRVCDRQCEQANDHNFWNLASSYLHFLNKDFDIASSQLGKVKSNDALYKTMVRNLTAYIDICRQPKITSDEERRLFAEYRDLFTATNSVLYDNQYVFNDYFLGGKTFINEVLTNRYALQGEKAKSFLVMHHLTAIEGAPSDKLLDQLQSFLDKKKKTPLEEYLAEKGTTGLDNYNNYIAYVKGVLRLTEGDFKAAKPLFDKQTRLTESKRIFGHNIRVWYSGEENVIMRDDYLYEFPCIHDKMNETEVTDALMQLQKIGDKHNGDESAKAYYLMGNFFYNVSLTGYYRHYLRFDNNNGFNYEKFGFDAESYQNTVQVSNTYLDKAMKEASDPELKAHIAFARAKNAQQDLERQGFSEIQSVSDPHYREFEKYEQTAYFKTVLSNCLYYRAYYTTYAR